MKKLFIILLFISFLICGCRSDIQARKEINQFMKAEVAGFMSTAKPRAVKCKKIKEQSNELKTIYVYVFDPYSKDHGAQSIFPYRIFYKLEYNKLTGQIKILKRTIYPDTLKSIEK